MIEVPPATPLAREIGAKFEKLMKRGGRIDQILAGGAGHHSPSLPEEEIERIKRNIETQLTEYAEALNAAVSSHQKYKRRKKNKGFRCLEVSRER